MQGVVHAKADPYYMGVAFQHPGNQVAMTGTSSGYTLYGDGTVKTLAGTVVQPALWPGLAIARDLVVRSNGTSGYILDGYGGIHAFGGAPAVAAPAYWSGWDVARSMVLLTDSSGYVLDGWGGIHPFGGAPAVSGGPHWVGWDIARSIVLLPNHTGGYVLDGYGGIHPFAIGGSPLPAGVNGAAYWPGWDIARDLVLDSQGTGGYLLDGYGGIHPFGSGATAPAGTRGCRVLAGMGHRSRDRPGWQQRRSDRRIGWHPPSRSQRWSARLASDGRTGHHHR